MSTGQGAIGYLDIFILYKPSNPALTIALYKGLKEAVEQISDFSNEKIVDCSEKTQADSRPEGKETSAMNMKLLPGET